MKRGIVGAIFALVFLWSTLADATIAVVNTTTAQGPDGQNALSINVPTLTGASVLLIGVSSYDNGGSGQITAICPGAETSCTSPWTLILHCSPPSVLFNQDWFYKYPSSEPASYTINLAANGFVATGMTSFSGTVTSGNPIDASVCGSLSGSGVTTLTAPSASPSGTGDMWIASYNTNNNVGTFTNLSSPWSTLFNLAPTADISGFAVYGQVLGSSSPTGTQNITITSNQGTGVSLLLLPSAATPTATATPAPTATATATPIPSRGFAGTD